MFSVSEKKEAEAPEAKEKMRLIDWHKSRLDLEEDEDSYDYWCNALGMLREWRSCQKKADMWEERLRKILPGSGVKLCPEALCFKDLSQESSIHTDE